MRVLILLSALGALAVLLAPMSAPPIHAADTVDAPSPRTAPVLVVRGHRTQRPEPATACEDALDEPPPDLSKTGPCAVNVLLVDAATGDRVKSVVQLWRLDAPGNAHYTRGDQRQASQTHEINMLDGVRFDKLPAGRYRIHAEAQPRGAEDPPAFVVDSAAATHVFEIAMPGRRPAWLRIHDEQGHPIQRATVDGGRMSGIRSHTRPAWRVARAFKGNAYFGPFVGGGGWSIGGGRAFRATEATADGFPLASIRQPSRTERVTERYEFRVPGRTRVKLEATYAGEREHAYEAVSIPIHPIRDAVRLTDGRCATAIDADFEAVCEARLAAPGRVFDPRDFVIQVVVTHKHFEPLKFQVRPGEPIEPRVWEPRPPWR